MRRNGYSLHIGPKSPSNSPYGTPPKVYLNDFEIFDNSELINMPLSSIDEIYYEHLGVEGNKGGSIHIFEKVANKEKGEKKFKQIVVTNAYKNSKDYQQKSQAKSKSNANFWIPQLLSNHGVFTFSFPQQEANSYHLNIQGFSKNGRLISIKKELRVN